MVFAPNGDESASFCDETAIFCHFGHVLSPFFHFWPKSAKKKLTEKIDFLLHSKFLVASRTGVFIENTCNRFSHLKKPHADFDKVSDDLFKNKTCLARVNQITEGVY